MKKYQVRVIEKHSTCVWVEAASIKEAKELAPLAANFEFGSVYDCKVMQWIEDPKAKS